MTTELSTEVVPSELLNMDVATVEQDPQAALAAYQQALAPQIASDKEDFDKVAAGKEFIPSVRLFSGKSEAVTTGLIPPSHWGVYRGKDKIEDLGQEIDCVPFAYRPKAMLIQNGTVSLTVYDQGSPDFTRLREMSLADGNSGAMFGPEFLMWVPKIKEFVVLHFAGKTARNTARALFPKMNTLVTMYSSVVKNSKYTWLAPQVKTCDVPITAVPNPKELVSMIEFFKNPQVAAGPELASDTTQEVDR